MFYLNNYFFNFIPQFITKSKTKEKQFEKIQLSRSYDNFQLYNYYVYMEWTGEKKQ